MGKQGNKSRESYFALRIGKSDPSNSITEYSITLQCFQGHFDRESPEVKKEHEYKVPNVVRLLSRW